MRIIYLLLSLSMTTAILNQQVQASGNITKADKAALKTEAISIVKQFGGALKPQLKAAMKKGGPVEAIKVCSEKAPAIAHQLTKKTGWTVKRVSLKARNSKTAIPDQWEIKILQQFNELEAKGESVKQMAYAEIVDGKFRFMKAQGIEKVCLTCHGETIKPRVERAIKLFYPQDQARGYQMGQVRGAFSLTKELN